MSKIVLWRSFPTDTSASSKTVDDVRRCCRELGFIELKLGGNLLSQFVKSLIHIGKKGTMVLVYPQLISPMSGRLFQPRLWLLRSLGLRRKVIYYVSDLPIEQNLANMLPIERAAPKRERNLLKIADYLIVFGEEMENAVMARHNLPDAKFIHFGLLDYMTNDIPNLKEGRLEYPIRIVMAGSLAPSVMGDSIKLLPKGYEDKIEYHVYGTQGEWIDGLREDVTYHGAVDSTELIQRISDYDFGLIVRDLTNKRIAEYLSLGSTSKFSLYMAAGLPILAPSQFSYPARLIESQKLGLVYDSLQQIPRLLESNQSRYAEFVGNLGGIQKRVATGTHFKDALSMCM